MASDCLLQLYECLSKDGAVKGTKGQEAGWEYMCSSQRAFFTNLICMITKDKSTFKVARVYICALHVCIERTF